MNFKLLVTVTASILAISACVSRGPLPVDGGSIVSGPNLNIVGDRRNLVSNPPLNIAPMQGDASTFEAWKASIRMRALASGVSEATFNAAASHMVYSPRVVEADRNQAEFVKPIWEYLANATGSRVGVGRAKNSEWNQTLSAIEQRYGVDRSVLLGIWGMETNYGSYMGSTNIFTSMATLAYDGRRRDFAEKELINAMHMVQRGERSASNLVGSWGAGMGQTQFIPSSFNRYAVDFTGDGRRDIWNATDALASTANYLRNEGWAPGLPWGIEVNLPTDFDYIEASPTNFLPSSYWASKGVTGRASALPNAELAIFLPAGANGPALAITRNFFAIRSYNPSDSYALAVAQLGDGATGRPTIQASWPRGEGRLTRGQVQQAQQKLMNMGYDTGGADGVAGRATQNAVRQFQASRGLRADGYLNTLTYQAIISG